MEHWLLRVGKKVAGLPSPNVPTLLVPGYLMDSLLRNSTDETARAASKWSGPGPIWQALFRNPGFRQAVLAALLLALASGVCFHRWVLHPTDVLVGAHDGGRTDITTFYGSVRVLQRDSVRRGEWPVWNPQLLCGTPVIGNPQSGMWYPVNWLFFLGEPMAMISFVLVLHHWFAGMGTYLLARRYKLGFGPGLLAGFTFLAAPFLVAATAEGHYNQTCLVAWVPWTLLGCESLRGGRPWGRPLTALAIAMSFFCGHAQESFYLVLLVSGFVVLDLLRPQSSGLQVARSELAKMWVVTGMLVLGLVAVDLLPIWLYTRQAVRASGISIAQASEISLGPASLWQLLDPFALGGPQAYHGPGKFYWETLCHFGVAPLLLAGLGAIGCRNRYPVGRLTLLAVLSLLFAFGDHTPLFPLLHKYVPGISFFRAPSRAIYFASLAVSLLAGFGCQSAMHWARQRHPTFRPRWALGLVAAAVACGLAGWAGRGLLSASPAERGALDLQLLWPAVFVATLLAITAWMVWQPRHVWLAALGAALLCLGEGTRHAGSVTDALPQGYFRHSRATAKLLARATQDSRGRVLANQDLLGDREAIVSGVAKLQGLEGVPLIRLVIPMVGLLESEEPVSSLMGFAPVALSDYPPKLLDLAAIEYAAVITSEPDVTAGWRLIEQGTTPREFALRGREPGRLPYAIFARENPMPRAYVQGNTRLLEPESSERQIRELEVRREVLVEQDPLPAGERQPFAAADIVEYSANRMRLVAELTAPGFLVLTDTYYPGWKADVGGQTLEVVPVNLGFRGVPLPAGRHEVLMTYSPPGLTMGLIISAVSAAWILLLLLPSSMNRKRQPDQPASFAARHGGDLEPLACQVETERAE